VEQGLQELGNKRAVLSPKQETTPNTLVGAPLKSPLGSLFFSDPSLLILLNPFSSDTPIPFL